MSYKISGLPAKEFEEFFGLSEEELASKNIKRVTAAKGSGYPDRIEMRDVDPGETLLLLNYEHLPVGSPYRSSHAIYVREGAEETYCAHNEIPEVLACRQQALRAFDDEGMMVDAEIVDGRAMEPVIEKMLANTDVAYIQTYNAARGCYSGRIDRD